MAKIQFYLFFLALFRAFYWDTKVNSIKARYKSIEQKKLRLIQKGELITEFALSLTLTINVCSAIYLTLKSGSITTCKQDVADL